MKPNKGLREMGIESKLLSIGILNLDATIPMYHEALRFLSYSLVRRGAEVKHLGCNAALQRCININSQPEIVKCSELETRKKIICTECQLQQNKIKSRRNFAVSYEVDKPTLEQEDLLKMIDTRLTQDPRCISILDLTFKHIEFCKIAFFDFSISGKITHLSILNDEEVNRFKQHIRDCLVLQNFFERVGRSCRFDIFLYVNGNYSHNTFARTVLKNNCLEFLSLEFQFSSYKTWNRIFFEKDRLSVGPKWPAITLLESSYKLKQGDLKAALHIMMNRFMGNDYNSYTYPGVKSAFAEFDAFRNKYKTIISYFSCSTDELFSHIITHETKIDNTFYSNQYELLDDFIANAKSDMGYVIRVHPRLAPNKRDRVLSREIFEIRKYLDLARTKENFFIIEAESPLSSYYIMLQSDLVLVAWSTIALEALTAGKPAFALFPSNCIFPMKQLCRQPSNTEEFRRIIQGMLPISEYTTKDIEVMKWISMVYNALGKPIPSPRGSRNGLFGRIYNLFYRKVISRTWAYDWFMSPLGFFATHAADSVLSRGKPIVNSSRSHDDLAAGFKELLDFRRKVRNIILR